MTDSQNAKVAGTKRLIVNAFVEMCKSRASNRQS